MQFFLTVPHDSAEEPTMASMDPAELEAALAAVEEFNTDLHKAGAFRFAGRRRRGFDGEPPLFTDFGHIALGAPRNRALAANRNPSVFDLGLCGPLRADLRRRTDYCGRFRTPTLRNVALRKTFFHNGVFHSLADVVRFYARRDTHPSEFYPGGAKFDDLPGAYRANVNTDPPFGRRPGDAPALDDDEIEAVVAFLHTLTDADLAR